MECWTSCRDIDPYRMISCFINRTTLRHTEIGFQEAGHAVIFSCFLVCEFYAVLRKLEYSYNTNDMLRSKLPSLRSKSIVHRKLELHAGTAGILSVFLDTSIFTVYSFCYYFTVFDGEGLCYF